MASLFRELLGDALDRVPAPVRALHEAHLPSQFQGRAIVRAADGLLARGLARMTGLPGATLETPISVTIEPDGDAEIWTRAFPPRPMRTRMWRAGEFLHERFGSIQLRFRLSADAQGIVWHPLSAITGGVAMPSSLVRGIHAYETAREGRYTFDVGAVLPWVGPLVAYAGWLDVD